MSQFNAPTYDIQRPTGQCAFSGRVLEPGESYMATLVEFDPPAPGEPDVGGPPSAAAGLGLRRLDVSMEAWTGGQRPDRLFGYWKSTVPQPHQKKKLFVDDEVLMSLLRRLAESDQPQRQAFRFVLALILMRKKLLRYDGTERRPGSEGSVQEWWRMIPRGAQEPIDVLNPHLDEEKIAQVRDQLAEILQAEL